MPRSVQGGNPTNASKFNVVIAAPGFAQAHVWQIFLEAGSLGEIFGKTPATTLAYTFRHSPTLNFQTVQASLANCV